MDLGLRCRKSFRLFLGSGNEYCAVHHCSAPPGQNRRLFVSAMFLAQYPKFLKILSIIGKSWNIIGLVTVFWVIKHGADAARAVERIVRLAKHFSRNWELSGPEKQQLTGWLRGGGKEHESTPACWDLIPDFGFSANCVWPWLSHIKLTGPQFPRLQNE